MIDYLSNKKSAFYPSTGEPTPKSLTFWGHYIPRQVKSSFFVAYFMIIFSISFGVAAIKSAPAVSSSAKSPKPYKTPRLAK